MTHGNKVSDAGFERATGIFECPKLGFLAEGELFSSLCSVGTLYSTHEPINRSISTTGDPFHSSTIVGKD